MRFFKILSLVILCFAQPLYGNTLAEVQQRGFLRCGVSQGLPGFSYPDAQGHWRGLDVDVCRAVACAIFGSPDKVQFRPLSAKERFTALHSGEIDLLSRNTTWTFTRDTSAGLEFVGVSYYDGQAFLVPKHLKLTTAKALSGATLCTNAGTTTELNTADYFRAHQMTYKIITFEKADEVVAAYNAGRCDVYTTDLSALAANRTKLSDPDAHEILPEVISKEPLGPVVRHGDNHWADVVRWVLYGLITAEEFGITAANLNTHLNSNNPAIRRFLGLDGELGEALSLSKTYMQDVIKGVGHYGEIFERNVGQESALGLERGLNQLWNEGGIMYAPPYR